MRAAQMALGEYISWEPESVWLELERQNIDVPVGNRAKIMAGLTLRLMPVFYWDAVAFEKTAIAFDNKLPQPEILEEASPAQLAWAVVEANWIIKDVRDTAWEFGHEPRAYTGVILNRAGFVLAPLQLDFAQPWLDRERQSKDLFEGVQKRWAGVSKDHLNALSLEETAEDVQIARLASVEIHVRTQRAAAEHAFLRLR